MNISCPTIIVLQNSYNFLWMQLNVYEFYFLWVGCVGSVFPFRERQCRDVAWHHVMRFLCSFSHFFNSIHTRNRQCKHKLLRTMVGKQFRDADKKNSHDPLEIISATSRATPFADRSSADSHRFFSHNTSVFPGPFFLFFLHQFYMNRPRSYLSPLPAPPTPSPCPAFYSPRTGPIFLPRQASFTSPLLPRFWGSPPLSFSWSICSCLPSVLISAHSLLFSPSFCLS